jgi:hypothetical protein
MAAAPPADVAEHVAGLALRVRIRQGLPAGAPTASPHDVSLAGSWVGLLALAHERSCEADLAATLVEPMATGSRAAIGAKRARNGARSGTPGARIGWIEPAPVLSADAALLAQQQGLNRTA